MEYRLLKMKVGGDTGPVLVVSHTDDAAAIAHARAFGRGRAVEVWSSERRIATILPGSKT